MMRKRLILLGLAIAMPAFAQAVSDDAKAFGARPALEDVSLSPDGTSIGFVAPSAGEGSVLFTVNIAQGADPRPALAVSGKPDRLDDCRFVAETRLVCTLFGAAKAPDYTLPLNYTRILATDAGGGNQRMLSNRQVNALRTSQDGGNVIDWLPGEDGKVLMRRTYQRTDVTGTISGSDRHGDGVDRIDVRTGSRVAVEQPRPRVAEFITDGHGQVRIAGFYQMLGATGQVAGKIDYRYRRPGSGEWLDLGTYDAMTRTGFNPYAVDPAKNVVYGLMKTNGRQALYTRALDGTGADTPILARPDVDVDEVIRIGRDRRIVGASYATDRRQAEYFDPEVRAQITALHKALPALPLIDIVDVSSDSTKYLVHAAADNDPGRYYLYDRATRKLQILMEDRPQLHGRALATVMPVRYPAADGTMIPGYLTMPAEGAKKGLPAIVMPHGGPSARDEWGFDWLAQFFAARGYAVLQPNYRGSLGYGDSYLMQNGFRAWRTAIGDVDDAGRWLVAQGIARPEKLAIVGWSFGGYAALQSGVIEPGLFKAIVAVAPVTDLASLQNDLLDFGTYHITKDFIGPLSRDASPAQNARRIDVPVLLAHGTLDSNVAYNQSILMAASLRSAGKKVEMMTFEGLDHQLYDSDARAKLLDGADRFLKAAFGG